MYNPDDFHGWEEPQTPPWWVGIGGLLCLCVLCALAGGCLLWLGQLLTRMVV